jgi:hypothetical protein
LDPRFIQVIGKDGVVKSITINIEKTLLVILLLTAGFGLFSACGKKGPPVPPKYVEPPVVNDLQYQINGNHVTLTWTIPKPERKPTYAISGSNVYRLKAPLDSDACPGCPLVFTLATKNHAKSGTGRHRETLERGFRYTFKVVTIDEANKEGPDSNLVQFTFK